MPWRPVLQFSDEQNPFCTQNATLLERKHNTNGIELGLFSKNTPNWKLNLFNTGFPRTQTGRSVALTASQTSRQLCRVVAYTQIHQLCATPSHYVGKIEQNLIGVAQPLLKFCEICSHIPKHNWKLLRINSLISNYEHYNAKIYST